MVIAALVSFSILLVAWIVAPSGQPAMSAAGLEADTDLEPLGMAA